MLRRRRKNKEKRWSRGRKPGYKRGGDEEIFLKESLRERT